MLKIKYAKHCHKHNCVEKVKRQLIKAYKIAEGLSSIYANIQLTGIEDIDYRNTTYYFDKEYENLRDRMSKEIEVNKEYNEGYNLSAGITVFQFLIELNKVLSIIGDYPAIPKKTVFYDFKSESAEDRYREVVKYFSSNPIVGYNQEYFAVNGDIERRIYPFTFTKDDLLNAQKVMVEYQ